MENEHNLMLGPSLSMPGGCRSCWGSSRLKLNVDGDNSHLVSLGVLVNCGLVEINFFTKRYCSFFRCYLTNIVQSWSN
jgi:hypothetical protein